MLKQGWRKLAAGALVIALGAGLGLAMTAGCGHSTGSGSSQEGYMKSSRAYKGHASDLDIVNFVTTYPSVYGIRLDDCTTCHWGQTVTDNTGKSIKPNPCAYCHYLQHPPAGYTGLPASLSQTLNPYGQAYMAAGRDLDALKRIEGDDSDGDGYSNINEINNKTEPGDPASNPGITAQCPVQTVTMEEIKSMPPHMQFMLANAQRQQYDTYATYTGVKIKDLLAAKGIDTSSAANIDIISPDGFKQTFAMAEINNQFPAHQFFAGLGVNQAPYNFTSACAFVQYPADTHGYGDGAFITDEQWHILAYERDGLALDPCYLDPVSGKIMGEGPFRNAIPPGSATAAYNKPDRASKFQAGCPNPEWNYSDPSDHNAGRMAKGAVVIRIQPMPTDCVEYDIVKGGFDLINAQEILIYGNGVK